MRSEVSNPFTSPPTSFATLRPRGALLGEQGKRLWAAGGRKLGVVKTDERDDEAVTDIPKIEVDVLMESLELKRGEFILKLSPQTQSPDIAELLDKERSSYRLRSTDARSYLDRPFSELALTDRILDTMGVTSKSLRKTLLALNQELDREVVAKVIDISSLVASEKDDEPGLEFLSTNAVLEYIDSLGYRPATFKELLAYANGHWHPEEGELLTDEERVQLANSKTLISFGSVMDIGGRYSSTYLWFSGFGRKLDCVMVENCWDENYRFLVVRKSLLNGSSSTV